LSFQAVNNHEFNRSKFDCNCCKSQFAKQTIIISNLTVAIFLLLSSITAILTGNKFIAFNHHPKLNRNEI
jgi:hypothetical protein